MPGSRTAFSLLVAVALCGLQVLLAFHVFVNLGGFEEDESDVPQSGSIR